jgi:hypothetical protein
MTAVDAEVEDRRRRFGNGNSGYSWRTSWTGAAAPRFRVPMPL